MTLAPMTVAAILLMALATYPGSAATFCSAIASSRHA